MPGALAGHFRRLRARNTSCREARRVLRNRGCVDNCSRWVSRGRAGVYRCTLRPNDDEGADFHCRGPGTRRVSWSSFS